MNIFVTGQFDWIPIPFLFLLTASLGQACVEIGYRAGRKRNQSVSLEKEAHTNAVLGALLGLFAFLLAITFGTAAGRFDERRSVVLNEANAIGTTYLRAGYVPEPHRSAIRLQMKEYERLKLGLSGTTDRIEINRRAEEMQDAIWTEVEAIARENAQSDLVAELVDSTNDVIDLHTARVTLHQHARVPATIWMSLLLLTAVSMASLGYHGGVGGSARSWLNPSLVLAFSIVITVIADLDRPFDGFITVDQAPQVDVLRSMNREGR